MNKVHMDTGENESLCGGRDVFRGRDRDGLTRAWADVMCADCLDERTDDQEEIVLNNLVFSRSGGSAAMSRGFNRGDMPKRERDVMESFLLALVAEGVDITTPGFSRAIDTLLEVVSNYS